MAAVDPSQSPNTNEVQALLNQLGTPDAQKQLGQITQTQMKNNQFQPNAMMQGSAPINPNGIQQAMQQFLPQ